VAGDVDADIIVDGSVLIMVLVLDEVMSALVITILAWGRRAVTGSDMVPVLCCVDGDNGACDKKDEGGEEAMVMLMAPELLTRLVKRAERDAPTPAILNGVDDTIDIAAAAAIAVLLAVVVRGVDGAAAAVAAAVPVLFDVIWYDSIVWPPLPWGDRPPWLRTVDTPPLLTEWLLIDGVVCVAVVDTRIGSTCAFRGINTAAAELVKLDRFDIDGMSTACDVPRTDNPSFIHDNGVFVLALLREPTLLLPPFNPLVIGGVDVDLRDAPIAVDNPAAANGPVIALPPLLPLLTRVTDGCVFDDEDEGEEDDDIEDEGWKLYWVGVNGGDSTLLLWAISNMSTLVSIGIIGVSPIILLLLLLSPEVRGE
jgi:hypothetical protein